MADRARCCRSERRQQAGTAILTAIGLSKRRAGVRTMARIEYKDFFDSRPDTIGGKFLRRFWHPVYRSQDLPSGRPVAIKILNEDLTLYRGTTGTPHIVGLRCAHRGTQLSAGSVEGDSIRCFYHG